MSGKHLRLLLRVIHVVGAVLIGTFVYSPWSSLPWFHSLMQFVVIPVLTLSGVVMWQQAFVVRLLQRGRVRQISSHAGN